VHNPIQFFLFVAESVPVLDVSGGYALDSLHAELAAQGIVLGIARPGGLFRFMLESAGIDRTIGSENIFPTVHAGVRSFQERSQGIEEQYKSA
jgi:MFS superfamily sulfate permease-like transporter